MSTDTSLRNIHHRRRERIDTRKDFKLKRGCFILKHLHMMMANNRYHVQGGSRVSRPCRPRSWSPSLACLRRLNEI
jgi:hypothetical protein